MAGYKNYNDDEEDDDEEVDPVLSKPIILHQIKPITSPITVKATGTGGTNTPTTPTAHFTSRVSQQVDNSEKLKQLTKKAQVGCKINWNKRFQELLDLPDDTEENCLKKYSKISALSTDFVHVAKIIGKLIITEYAIDPDKRTIAVAPIGGEAGGSKFIHHGILFKFATDWKRIYQSDESAMKAAGHELKSVMRYAQCDQLHVPLMALIDYRGYRLVAESILPINKFSIQYGSADGGKTILANDQVLNNLMKKAGEKLNLKGHFGGKASLADKKFIYGPTDIEGHVCDDSRCYVIDFARAFPPTAEADVRSTFLYKLFRPEFVKNYKIPLSSDAFSPFGYHNKQEHDQEVREATNYLFDTVIPDFAGHLPEIMNNVDVSRHLTELVHRAGINVRYLGKIRVLLQDDTISAIIFNEMCARVIKNRLRKNLRKIETGKQSLVEHKFRLCVIKFLNLVLGNLSFILYYNLSSFLLVSLPLPFFPFPFSPCIPSSSFLSLCSPLALPLFSPCSLFSVSTSLFLFPVST